MCLGRLLQTQTLFTKKTKIQDFLHSCGTLQASLEKPESLVIAAMLRLEEISVSLRTEKSVFFNWMKTSGAFFLFCFFLPGNTSGPIYSVAFGLCSASIIEPLLHLVVPWLDMPTVHLENLRLYLEQLSLSPDASGLAS